jgi:hypothetical protein
VNTPQELSSAEWKELMQVPVIRESWGMEKDETPEDFADMVYGVKFNFASGMAPATSEICTYCMETLWANQWCSLEKKGIS